MLGIRWGELNESQKTSINDLIRASVGDIVRVNEVDRLIEEGIIESMNDLEGIQKDAETILRHRCSERCLRRISDGNGRDSFVCRKPNNFKMSTDNTRGILKPIKMQYTAECIERLATIGLAMPIQVNENNWESEFISYHPFF